jgi:hypothetical protein
MTSNEYVYNIQEQVRFKRKPRVLIRGSKKLQKKHVQPREEGEVEKLDIKSIVIDHVVRL